MRCRWSQHSMFWVAAFLAACTSSEVLTHGHPASGAGGSPTGATGGTGQGSETGRGGMGATAGAGPGIIAVPDSGMGGAPNIDASCAGSVTEARLIPLDLF